MSPARKFDKSKRSELLSFEEYGKQKGLDYLIRYEKLLKRGKDGDKLKKCQKLIALKKRQPLR